MKLYNRNIWIIGSLRNMLRTIRNGYDTKDLKQII